MEALNKHLTGDETVFSEQYFVDCTFDYSGCAGGVVNEGYKLTKMRQYLVSAEDIPYTGDCKSTFQSYHCSIFLNMCKINYFLWQHFFKPICNGLAGCNNRHPTLIYYLT